MRVSQQLANLFALHLQLQLGQVLAMRHLVLLVGRVSCVFGLGGWNLEFWHLHCTNKSDYPYCYSFTINNARFSHNAIV